MTTFEARLAFPAGDPSANNFLVMGIVEGLDQAECLVQDLHFGLYRFNMGQPAIYAAFVTVKCSSPLDNASQQEKETWLQSRFDLTPNMPDCAVVWIH